MSAEDIILDRIRELERMLALKGASKATITKLRCRLSEAGELLGRIRNAPLGGKILMGEE